MLSDETRHALSARRSGGVTHLLLSRNPDTIVSDFGVTRRALRKLDYGENVGRDVKDVQPMEG